MDFALLKPLQPLSIYLLVVAALFLLIGIAGGGRLQIRDLTLGNLGKGARLLAIVFGLALGVMFLLIPRVEKGFDIQGKIMPAAYGSLKGDVEIGIARKIDRIPVEKDGTFTIPKKLGLSDQADFNLLVYENGMAVTESFLLVEKGKQIIIREDEQGNWIIEREKLVKYLMDQYKSKYKYWGDKLQAIEQLVDCAREDEEVKEGLVKMLDGEDECFKILSALVLGQLGESAAQPCLEEIVKDDSALDDRAQIYRRLQAAWCLAEFFSHEEARQFLFDTVNNRQEKRGARISAALLLSRKGTRNACVIEQLIEGLKSRYIVVKEHASECLVRSTNKDFDQNYERWKTWWDNNKNNFDPC